MLSGAVRKVSTGGRCRTRTPNFDGGPDGAFWCAVAGNGDEMGVLIYILLTVAIFAILGLAQKLVERL